MLVVVVGMVAAEIGFMLSEVPNTMAGAAALGTARSGLAAGLLGTGQQLGHALGLASISTVIAALNSTTNTTVSSLRWGFAPASVAILLALTVSLRHLSDRFVDDAGLTPLDGVQPQTV
jgi:hypothetical protein